MLTADHISLEFAGRKVLSDLSFTLESDCITALVGPNGAGKSSLLRLLAGLVQPTSGELRIDGEILNTDLPAFRRRIGFLPENDLLYPELTALANLEYVAGLYNLAPRVAKERIEKLSVNFGFDSELKRPVHELSKGFVRRVSIAASQIHDPDILLLDEPSSGLDLEQVAKFRLLLKEVSAGKLVVLTSHILRDISQLASRIVFLDSGRIVRELSSAQGEMAGDTESVIEDFFSESHVSPSTDSDCSVVADERSAN